MKNFKLFIFTLIVTVSITYSANTKAKSDGGLLFISSYSEVQSFCSSTYLECTSIEFWVHPFRGNGYMVSYDYLNCDKTCCPDPQRDCDS